ARREDAARERLEPGEARRDGQAVGEGCPRAACMTVGVIGGGLAGLAAACELVDRGHAVTLLERRPWAGGKTYSFVDRESGEAVDNGQHIAMRCTTAYIAFLEKLGTEHLMRWQKRQRVP